MEHIRFEFRLISCTVLQAYTKKRDINDINQQN